MILAQNISEFARYTPLAPVDILINSKQLVLLV